MRCMAASAGHPTFSTYEHHQDEDSDDDEDEDDDVERFNPMR